MPYRPNNVISTATVLFLTEIPKKGEPETQLLPLKFLIKPYTAVTKSKWQHKKNSWRQMLNDLLKKLSTRILRNVSYSPTGQKIVKQTVYGTTFHDPPPPPGQRNSWRNKMTAK